MNLVRSQRGISIWVAMLLVICIAFSGLIALKLFPVYLESMKIDRGLEGLFEGSEVNTMNKGEIKDALLRRLDIDSVDQVNHRNFWDVVTISKDGDTVTIDVAYEVVVPIAGNVSALVEFEKSANN